MSAATTPTADRRDDGARDDAPQRVRLFGVEFDNVTMPQTVRRIEQLVRERRDALVVTPNVDHVIRISEDASYAALVRSADLVLADGQPLIWASRLVGRPLKERVAGSDLLPALAAHAAESGLRLFFLGGDPGAADEARDVLTRRHPKLQVVGVHCPPMGFERDPQANQAALDAVVAARPDVVLVGLGSPKQERWIAEHRKQYGPAVSIGVGVSFSFEAGSVQRAPVWMRRVGLEWLHRLFCEPRRLWRRYLLRGTRFLPLVWREWRRRKASEGESA